MWKQDEKLSQKYWKNTTLLKKKCVTAIRYIVTHLVFWQMESLLMYINAIVTEHFSSSTSGNGEKGERAWSVKQENAELDLKQAVQKLVAR